MRHVHTVNCIEIIVKRYVTPKCAPKALTVNGEYILLSTFNFANINYEFFRTTLETTFILLDATICINEGGFKCGSEELVVYVCEVEGCKKYVFPVYGKGLWGALWGYVALNDDFNTVYGMYMSHASETAGLGSLIAEQKFQDQFIGKTIFAEGNANDIALSVVKNGKVQNSQYEVDGITGATLTGNGVDAMFKTSLAQYIGFFNANK
ncbi:MAG: NADH:ubiquinone reductase (Na(+)-transporting) subunit C [Clostridia bacterium]|nr:NADH:ubiquinone reductase (Na(+)-transporting) subunit C [Clostridia bacterium]